MTRLFVIVVAVAALAVLAAAQSPAARAVAPPPAQSCSGWCSPDGVCSNGCTCQHDTYKCISSDPPNSVFVIGCADSSCSHCPTTDTFVVGQCRLAGGSNKTAFMFNACGCTGNVTASWYAARDCAGAPHAESYPQQQCVKDRYGGWMMLNCNCN
jgi:hypothetical protein